MTSGAKSLLILGAGKGVYNGFPVVPGGSPRFGTGHGNLFAKGDGYSGDWWSSKVGTNTGREQVTRMAFEVKKPKEVLGRVPQKGRTRWLPGPDEKCCG